MSLSLLINGVTHRHQQSKLRLNGALPPLPHFAFMACTEQLFLLIIFVRVKIVSYTHTADFESRFTLNKANK